MDKTDEQGATDEVTFGKALVAARDAAGVDQRWVCDTTKIQKRYVEALEQEDWKSVPGGIIGRGFVRLIAKELEADVQKLCELYCMARGEEAPNSMKPPPETHWKVGGPSPLISTRLIAAVAILLVCIGVLMWLWRPWEELDTVAVVEGDAALHKLEVLAVERTWLSVKARDAKPERYELEPTARLDLEVISPVTLKSDNAASIQVSWDGISLKPLGERGTPLELTLPEGLAGLKP